MSVSTIEFLNALYAHCASKYIEIRVIDDRKPPVDKKAHCSFHECTREAATFAANAVIQYPNHGVYFGINQRDNPSGKAQDVPHAGVLWADLDVGTAGHRQTPAYENFDAARQALDAFEPKPSIIVNSGGGLHVYWLIEPVDFTHHEEVQLFENTNRAIAHVLRGDNVGDIPRVFRLPDTPNRKIPDTPRLCEVVDFHPERRYKISDFAHLRPCATSSNKVTPQPMQTKSPDTFDKSKLPAKIKNLIQSGDWANYQSRSECDMAIIAALVNTGASDAQILQIYGKYACGEKFREKGTHGESYLSVTIRKARDGQKEQNMKSPAGTNGRRFDPTPYVNSLLKKHTFVYEPESGFYQWTDNRYFRRLKDEHVLSMIEIELVKESSVQRRREVIEKLKLHPSVLLQVGRELNPNRNFINLQNGMFDLVMQKMEPHDIRFLSTIPLSVSYNQQSTCPRWMQFLEEIFPNPADRNILQEMFGYCLTPETRAEKAFILFGEGANGKSKVCDVLLALLGNENCSHVQLSDLGRDFHTIALRNKLVNLATDIDARDLSNGGMLKTIVSGEPVQDAHKHKDIVSFTPFAKQICSTNTLPRINDKSHGLYRKLTILEFPRRFEDHEQDKTLGEKLKSELEGILLWATEGLRRLRQNHWIFTYSVATERMIYSYKRLNDPVVAFVDAECDTTDANARTIKNVLYKAYHTWATTNGYHFQSRETFFRDLKRAVPDFQEEKPRNDEGGRTKFIRGIALQTE